MRKRRAVKRDVLPDPIYNSKVVTKLVNTLMIGGKKGTAQKILYEAFDIIKAEDAETAITVHTIRTWCKQGKIKCLTAGNKVLVDMQSLLDYIAIKTDNTEV